MAHDLDTDQQPLQGVVLCCTSLAQDVRTNLAEIASQMGAAQRLDLTADVTHLLVGNINTPKYKYVAKERPDIRVLAPGFIAAVRDAWTAGGEVDVESFEQQYTLPAFFGLQLCLTGVEDMAKRKEMEDAIIANGATYNGDLTKQVTHLIVARPTGAKYTYAKQWNIHVVSLKWYTDCLTRGMAVDESCYSPEMPLEEQGVGAFRTRSERTISSKRKHEEEQSGITEQPGRKKLRKSYSQRINAQSQELWQSLSGHEVQVDNTTMDAWNDESQTLQEDSTTILSATETDSDATKHARSSDQPQGLFSGYWMSVHGFDDARTRKLRRFLEPNGATIVASPNDLQAAPQMDPPRSSYLVVPHDMTDTMPNVPSGTLIVTEWWVERCIHFKTLLDPSEDPLCSTLPNTAVTGFQDLIISTTGFNGVDFRQIAEAVPFWGAKYQEQLSRSTSILICGADTVKKEKAFYANKYRIPTVSAAWLWQSWKTKEKAPIDAFTIKLQAMGANEMLDSPSTSSPALDNGRVPPFRRSSDVPKRADDLNVKRLSNTRMRRVTPVLPMKASRTTPNQPSKSSVTKCPFVLEDEDEDDQVEQALIPSNASVSAPSTMPSEALHPLREISPNRSQPKGGSQSQAAVTKVHTAAAPHSPRNIQEMENQNGPVKKQDLTSELASLLYRNVESDGVARPPEEKRRKNRPLGRNLSVVSNRSNSGSPALPAVQPDDASPADGFPSLKEVVQLPPSTQLGYETPEGEAHRREMSRKMGVALPEERGIRNASIGTVKDSREMMARSAAAGSRGKTRSRPKA